MVSHILINSQLVGKVRYVKTLVSSILVSQHKIGLPRVSKHRLMYKMPLLQGLGTSDNLWKKIKADFSSLFWRSRGTNRINPWQVCLLKAGEMNSGETKVVLCPLDLQMYQLHISSQLMHVCRTVQSSVSCNVFKDGFETQRCLPQVFYPLRWQLDKWQLDYILVTFALLFQFFLTLT